jgi:hypothetical protein
VISLASGLCSPVIQVSAYFHLPNAPLLAFYSLFFVLFPKFPLTYPEFV